MIDPKLWGPPAWKFLHYITIAYPDNPTEKNKEDMKFFFKYLREVIPCDKCKMNFSDHLKEHPLTDETLICKQNLVKWLINVHNSVNKMTNKEIVNYDEAMKLLLNEEKDVDCVNLFIGLVIIFLTMIVLIYLFKK